MPDTIDHGLAPWLIEIIAELGVARSGMSGLVGLDYGEIESYERFAGIKLGRAAIMIRKISASYATGYNEGQNEKSPLPWKQSGQAVADALGDFLAGLG